MTNVNFQETRDKKQNSQSIHVICDSSFEQFKYIVYSSKTI